MKKTTLILLLIFAANTKLFAQNTKNDFIGYWTSDGTQVECIIWKDKYDEFQFVAWDKQTGQSLEILSLKFENYKLIVRTRFKKNNWVVTNEFTLIDEYNISAKLIGDGNTFITYKKLK
jgi:hypothetical protein